MQVVECFPNTLLKLLPNTIQKTKWTKKSKEITKIYDHFYAKSEEEKTGLFTMFTLDPDHYILIQKYAHNILTAIAKRICAYF